MKHPQKILVIQTAFAGDVILATSLLEKLHYFFPKARIDFLIKKGNEEFFTKHPFLYQLLVWDKKHAKYSNLFKLIVKIRKQKYDWLINLQRFVASGLLTVFSRAKYTVGFNKNPFSIFFSDSYTHIFSYKKNNNLHEVIRNNSLIAQFIGNSIAKPKIYPSAQNYESIKVYQQKPYICIAPGSLWFTKQFPLKKWQILIDVLPFDGNFYLLGGKEEIFFCDKIISGTKKKNIVNLAGKLNFLSSATLMEKAIINYVNDSAPLHLASAVDANTCAIFCSTIPAFGFGPLSKKSAVVEIDKPLSCRPCGLHGLKKCPRKHFKCAYDIPIKKLVNVFIDFSKKIS